MSQPPLTQSTPYLLEQMFQHFEKEKIKKIAKQKTTDIGIGYALDDAKKEHLLNIGIVNTNRKNHVFIFGTSGVGKTKLAQLTIVQDIYAGRNVVFIDPKPDKDMLNVIVATTIKAKRTKDLMFMSSIFPELSIEMNPTSHYYIYEEVIQHVLNALPLVEEFYQKVAKETTMSIVQGIVLKRKATGKTDIKINFEEIAKYAHLEGLKNLYDSINNINDKELKDEIAKTRELIQNVLKSPADYFSKVSTTLRTTLSAMVNGNVGKILGNATENTFVERLEGGQGVILYVQTGSLIVGEIADVVGREVVSMVQSVVGRYYLSGKAFKHELCLYIDELSNVAYQGIENLYNKGRGAGVWIIGMTQSIADLVKNLGEDGARQLLDNTNTKIILRVQDKESAETFSVLGGMKKINSPIISTNGGVTAREIDDYAVLPQDLLRLQHQEFYYFGFEGQFFGKTSTVKSPNFDIVMPNILQAKNADTKAA